MKQTAVEWLEEKFKNSHANFINWSLENFEQAKEMEKQQIINAYGNKTKKSGSISNSTYILTGEQYYNETFKKK